MKSSNDGRALEGLVRTIEEFFLPKGCQVEPRQRVYGESGAQLAELDIVITGRLGTTEIRWLIECRDRPSDGPAPTSWINELYGRKHGHGFNQVTAVSTTGFAAGAKEMAANMGVELRSVSDASPADVSTWLAEDFRIFTCACMLRRATFAFPAATPPPIYAAAQGRLADLSESGEEMFLRSSKTQQLVDATAVFVDAVQAAQDAGHLSDEEVVPNDPHGRDIRLHVKYPTDGEHYLLDTAKGQIRVEAIDFDGRLLVNMSHGNLDSLKAYKRDGSAGTLISHTAIFAVEGAGAKKLTLELHNLADTGDTHVVVTERERTYEVRSWLWTFTDKATGERRQTRQRMTEAEAHARYGDSAAKVEGSLEVRQRPSYFRRVR